jgi:hypothetical protein
MGEGRNQQGKAIAPSFKVLWEEPEGWYCPNQECNAIYPFSRVKEAPRKCQGCGAVMYNENGVFEMRRRELR